MHNLSLKAIILLRSKNELICAEISEVWSKPNGDQPQLFRWAISYERPKDKGII